MAAFQRGNWLITFCAAEMKRKNKQKKKQPKTNRLDQNKKRNSDTTELICTEIKPALGAGGLEFSLGVLTVEGHQDLSHCLPLLPTCACAERSRSVVQKILCAGVLVVSSACSGSARFGVSTSLWIYLFYLFFFNLKKMIFFFEFFFCLIAICLFPIPSSPPQRVKSWRCGHWQCAEWKTEQRLSPPPSPSPAPPPVWARPPGGAGPVRAARFPCISCGGWRPGP